tara:strand:- start:305 stop:601 length:297 start_codon:yes stop_codon:yes gene_type:complete
MSKWLLVPLIGSTTFYPPYPVVEPAPQEQQDSADEDVEDCKKGVEGLRNDVLGLELFLKDKSDHRLYCPLLNWEQPTLETYKEDPKSHLPEECTRDKI